ncbi:MAG TPA: phasin family protein [Steroidobacteraceae bacterium]|nr:phasin family protein [Gammaproteobacteria bacterium]HEV2286540.1 phasin family protein [Steroidobacteraceae bacterium]
MPEQSNPFADLTKLIEHFKVPGIDLSAMVESGRKDMEALIEANKAAFQGVQALALKQQEMLTEAMHKIEDYAKHAGAGSTSAKQAETAREAYHRVLADMKELAQIVRNSQAQAMTQMTDRAIEHLRELKRIIQPK